jgi:hypothetical protein
MQGNQENNQQVNPTVDNNVSGQQSNQQPMTNQGSQPVIAPQETPAVDNAQQPTQDKFKDAQAKAQKKAQDTQVQQQNEDVVKNFVSAFQQEYSKDESLKGSVESEVKYIESLINIQNKDEVILKLLEASVEKIEQQKKKSLEIQKEKEEIQKIIGYTDTIKKIDLIKKDKNYSEVLKILENISPKLAFEHGKSLTNNFIASNNIPMSNNNVGTTPQPQYNNSGRKVGLAEMFGKK